MTFIPPDELEALNRQRRQNKLQYQQGLGTRQFQRDNQKTAYNQKTVDMSQAYEKARKTFTSPYSQRGLLRSGIYKNNLTEFATARYRQESDIAEQHRQALAQLGLQDSQALEAYNATNLDITEMDKARRAALAAQLKNLA
jgi:hypothetical protein